jgi:Family of unknown function (DUF6247)
MVLLMTAAAVTPDPGDHGLASASPAALRAVLLPEDVDRFDGEWQAAMATATESLELGAVQAFLRRWRLIARLTVGLGHDGYRRMLAEAEQRTRSGELPVDAVPIDEVRLKLAARIAAGQR